MNDVQSKLDHLATILIAGVDARNFLHGQITADLNALTTSNVMLAACNSPQGRVQAILWTIERTEGIVLLLTRAVAESVATRLRRYVLRAKVSIEADTFAVGVALPQHILGKADINAEQSHQQIDDISYLRLSGHRQLLTIGPQSASMAPTGNEHVDWRIDHLRSGYPQIYPATQERFVAQMLNLDLLGGISFEKGCYTGQEIIARTHFRGAIKRRMFRFAADCSPPTPGTRLLVDAQHAGDVVDAVETSTGCELLAVVSLAQADAQLSLETNDRAKLQKLTLPYVVA